LPTGRTIVQKSRKHTKRGDHYRTMAEGYQILKSPLAEAYNAAAEHYQESDPPREPLAPVDGSEAPARKSESDDRPD
jgi:hypothetical protein